MFKNSSLNFFNQLMRDLAGNPNRVERQPPKPAITVDQLIAKGVSHVRLGDKIYRIECTEYGEANR